MATAAAGGLFNAFAFAGAGYLFKMFDKNRTDTLRKLRDITLQWRI